MKPKTTICLWFDKDAHEAARFYAATFPDSKVTAVHKAPGDYPGGKEGDVLTVEFTVLGIPCLGLNGGPVFKHSEAFSFQIATDNQEETDRYWNAIVGNGGNESQCGWCKDRWGLSWQITPRALTDALPAPSIATSDRRLAIIASATFTCRVHVSPAAPPRWWRCRSSSSSSSHRRHALPRRHQPQAHPLARAG